MIVLNIWCQLKVNLRMQVRCEVPQTWWFIPVISAQERSRQLDHRCEITPVPPPTPKKWYKQWKAKNCCVGVQKKQNGFSLAGEHSSRRTSVWGYMIGRDCMPGGRWYVCLVLCFGPQRSQSLFFLVLTLQRFFPNFHVEACIFLKILLKAFKAINAFCTRASQHRRQKNRNSLKLLLTFRSGLVMETGSRNQIGCHKLGDTMLTNIGKYYISLQAESLLETRDLNQNDGNLTCIANVKSRLIQSTHEGKKKKPRDLEECCQRGLWASHRKNGQHLLVGKTSV